MKKGKVVIDYDARRIGFKNETRLVGKANRYTTIEYEDIVINAAKAAAVPESSIEMSMEALFDAMTYFVLNGHSVQIPNLGTFSLAISCKTSQNESDFKQNFAENLRRVYIRFLPDVGLKEMIASTRVETQCGESAIYNPDAVVAITSCVMSDGSHHYPLIEGRSYPVSPVTNITFNGTRLSKAYLGVQPVTLTYLKDDGTEVTALLPTTAVNMRYSQLIVSFYKVKELIPSAFAIKAIVVKDVNDVTILSKTFGNIPQTAYISAISVDEKPVAPGDTVKYTTGMVAKMKLIGFKFNLVASVEIGGQEIETKEIGVDRIQLDYAPLTTGNTPVQLTDGESAIGDPYNMSFGDVASVVVTAVTANGDPLVNGGVTSITAGNSYPLQVTGTGLDVLEAEDFVVPEGSQLTIVSQSATMIQATMTNAQAGTFKIQYHDADIFTASLVAVTADITVTGYKLSAEGATQALATAIASDQNSGSFSAILVGENLDDLTTASFSIVDGSFSGLAYNPATATIAGTCISSGHLRIADNSTTIATLSVARESSGGDAPLDEG